MKKIIFILGFVITIYSNATAQYGKVIISETAGLIQIKPQFPPDTVTLTVTYDKKTQEISLSQYNYMYDTYYYNPQTKLCYFSSTPGVSWVINDTLKSPEPVMQMYVDYYLDIIKKYKNRDATAFEKEFIWQDVIQRERLYQKQ